MIEAVIKGIPRVYYAGIVVDGRTVRTKRTLSVLAETLISAKDNTWQEFMVEYTSPEPFNAMYVKKGDTIFVDGESIGFQRLGGGSIARLVHKVVATNVETPSVPTILKHNCGCGYCSRRN